jgi:hypothetical protein
MWTSSTKSVVADVPGAVEVGSSQDQPQNKRDQSCLRAATGWAIDRFIVLPNLKSRFDPGISSWALFGNFGLSDLPASAPLI